MINRKLSLLVSGFIAVSSFSSLVAQTTTLTLHLDDTTRNVSPMLYGLMTEEINYAYDGGIYAEIIRNRSFKDNDKYPEHWTLNSGVDGQATMSLTTEEPLNDANKMALKLTVTKAGSSGAGIANSGYWGIPVRPNTEYKGFFYAKSSDSGMHLFSVSIENDSTNLGVYAMTKVSESGPGWKKYEFSLKTGNDVRETSDAKFIIRTMNAGTFYFSTCSLFPPTFNNRPNGNRPDIMQLLADMKPSFLRLPGGNFLEGGKFSTRYDWKKTLGPIEDRPGHMGTWGYRSSDGMGLLDYLQWCEDIHCEPLLAVFAGYTLEGDHLEGPLLEPFIDEALEEIEYIIGDVHSKWGAKRASDGHPEPFPLHFVEIGNEDFFDHSGSYKQRFAQFYNAIKEKYPQLTIISTFGKDFDVPGGKADMIDDHFYRNAADFESSATFYDNYDRKGPKVLVGEWATREGSPTPNFNAALGDAAWLTGLERNSDIVLMSCYAPLFVNVNKGAMQWESDLIGYNVLNSYGSPSYYVQKMFSNHLGNKVVPIDADTVLTQQEQLNEKEIAEGRKSRTLPTLFFVATRDSKNGNVFLKIVNTKSVEQKVKIKLEGIGKVQAKGKLVVLHAATPLETNSIKNPTDVIPVQSEIKGVSKSFDRNLPPYSVSVIQLKAD
ncbi:alpha-N-arabinofuranosidase [Arachidicoccus rhizosphaerae]|uniref:non-reducing end alpha-L-arabinofuranosidase n=1 Tax=Arachidicoccus rhizosphaerae TaxID=551991 RepID=A0A1H3VE75_9BACT|nr:alpha-L-arabinofuranosidase C-terminal domain-containing protein [Arachidicoccus rhizosphaerae]SDZ73105.1 alpha-N-arabinofuranosidase [Arachidicoccus rhizosphaerae]